MIIALAAAIGLAATPSAQADPAIDDYLTSALETTGLPGFSVVVTKGDQVVHAAGYGHDSEGRPMTADTPMRVASVSKSFTAMAVMTLVDSGRIALDRPVAEQLPGFSMADPRAAQVTVRQLLNQTSGFSDTTIDINALEEAGSLADYTARLSTGSLAADPGTHWEYCNVNYDLAGRLVEVVSGQPFGDYLREHVFGPLGMRTSASRVDEVRPADGYVSLFGAWIPRAEMPGFHDDSGGGGVITTAADMGKWLISQNGAGQQLVTPDSLRLMHSPSAVNDYGMGWGVEHPEGGPEMLMHAGNLFTYNAMQAIVPETGYGFAVMTNGASLHESSYDILMGLVALSEGKTPPELSNGRQQNELVLGAISLVAVGLGVLGAVRSRRWAAKRAGRSGWLIGLRVVPLLIPLAIFVAYPDLVSFISNGRTVTWSQMTYFPLPLTVTLLIAALAGVSTVAFRLVRLRSARAAGRVADAL
ncbi:CubicO group peptidase, beta-lactamase class C family [Saccharopolyspora antimicrobica]|uniref:CubicO group peptidase (Beta-lactamase class C family) n=1 Tax=Saccharopolyspora antimicrobica TaxID=455193 RepID=A0A1I5IX83_9PSEU|nr:serine hydrolase [Saccharopolyspora antimicrobica]RKT83736.1 CubicO group peptidase (beta-lactamase class C family) [Saccharopolyspora antimicrobica]SFO64761.1 CubicO group peptidase, beta-lactamase class C family [Saccharopolyspora antimicrobica]